MIILHNDFFEIITEAVRMGYLLHESHGLA